MAGVGGRSLGRCSPGLTFDVVCLVSRIDTRAGSYLRPDRIRVRTKPSRARNREDGALGISSRGCASSGLAFHARGGGRGSLLCSAFSFHTSPPSKNSFFHMGTVALSSSIA